MKAFKYLLVISVLFLLFSCGGGSGGGSTSGTSGTSGTATVSCPTGSVCLPSSVSIVQPSSD